MAVLLKTLYQNYKYLIAEVADPRANNYLFMSSPFPLISIVIGYIYFCLKIGPKFMENRKPFKIDNIIAVYNVVQILVCGLIVYAFVTLCLPTISWRCEPINYSTTDENAVQILFYVWVYHIIKILDLLDTIFFVLRKKFNHITFLHVYHHAGMVILTWFGVKYVGGGHGTFIGLANGIVHIFMYFYYLMSIYNENFKKSLWWKKYITQLQIIQFLFLAIIFGQILLYTDCDYPKFVSAFFLPQNLFMFLLFCDFYYKSYIKEKPKVQKGKQELEESLFVNSVTKNIDEQKTK